MAKLLIKHAFLLSILIIPIFGNGQIKNLLKEKAKSAINNKTLRDKAKDIISDELEEIRDEYDSSSFNYAIALSDNAGLFESKERFERHQKFLIEYVNRQEGELSAEDQARAWVDRAELLYANGKYKLAAGLLVAAKTLYEEENMTRSIEYAKTIANISLVAHSLGRYNFAIDAGQNSLEMRKSLFGEDSRGYAASLNNVGLIKKDLGFYNESERMLSEAADKNKQVLGAESMGYAISLNNLANLNQTLGRYEEAEKLYKQSLSIAEIHLKEKSGNFQRLQTNLALLYQDMGRFEEAEKIYLEAIRLRKKRLSESHPDYAHLLINLASLYVQMEKYEEVEELLTTSIGIYKKKFGDNSPATAGAKSDLGNFYVFRGEFNKALPLLKEASDIRDDMLGAKHPHTIQSAEDLAIVNWRLGNIESAITLYDEVMKSTYQMIDDYFMPMSENEKSRFWSTLKPRINRYYSFVYENHNNYPNLLEDLVVLQTATKAMLMNSSSKIRSQILNGNDENLKRKYNDWLDQKELLANYYTYSKEELQEEKINIDSLERAANTSERYLSENSDSFRASLKQNRKSMSDLKNVLGSDEVLVEVIHSDIFTHKLTGESRYLFLVLRKDLTSPRLLATPNGNLLDGRYYKYYSNVIHGKMEDDYSYDQFLKPFETAIAAYSKIYFSPDGVYNQINLSSLKGPNGYFIHTHEVVLINNPGDIVELKRGREAQLNPQATFIGYPEYGGTGKVPMLPGTKKEIESISRLLSGNNYKTDIHIGKDANELTIKSLQPNGILHIATHGYFLENVSNKQESVFGIQTQHASDNPLLRSGLMFSGAGYAVEGEPSHDFSGNNEGLLTAYEAMNLNLDQTNMVVLSACETATGDVQSGEGVYGLQRAFLVAGAKSLVMSLWKVDDDATQKLMTLFYGNLLKNQDKSTAFRNAQLSLMKEFDLPYYWGAFVLVMD